MNNKENRETIFSKIKKKGWKFVAAYLAVKWTTWGMVIYFGGKYFTDN